MNHVRRALSESGMNVEHIEVATGRARGKTYLNMVVNENLDATLNSLLLI